jgi:integrase
MGKRGNGEGSITRRKDGLYMARYTVEAATGSKRKAVYAKTRKEAAEKLTAAMADASKGITADGGPKTVGAFLTSWLENSVRGSVRKSTYDRNESLCRVHLIPALGRKKLKTLGAADVAGFYRSRLDSGCSAASVQDTAIVRMVIDLAHTFGMEVVGEGVENKKQAEQLREMGCDMAQGYYFHKPMPSEATSALLAG